MPQSISTTAPDANTIDAVPGVPIADQPKIAAPAAPITAAVAAVINDITIVLPPPVAAASKAAGAGQKIGQKIVAPKPAPKPPQPQISPGVTTSERFDANGNKIIEFADGKGAGVRLTVKPDRDVKAEFFDEKRQTTTHSDKAGFSGTTRVQEMHHGVLKPRDILESAHDPLFQMTEVNCDGKGVRASTNVVDAVTRERIQAFAKEHPELAAKVRQTGLPITTIGSNVGFGGEAITLEQVEKTPSQFRACPEGRREEGIKVERLTR